MLLRLTVRKQALCGHFKRSLVRELGKGAAFETSMRAKIVAALRQRLLLQHAAHVWVTEKSFFRF